jgi:hypothetical protein
MTSYYPNHLSMTYTNPMNSLMIGNDATSRLWRQSSRRRKYDVTLPNDVVYGGKWRHSTHMTSVITSYYADAQPYDVTYHRKWSHTSPMTFLITSYRRKYDVTLPLWRHLWPEMMPHLRYDVAYHLLWP